MPRDVMPGCAFFDVDETLISIKSMLSFQDFWFRESGDPAGRVRFDATMAELRTRGASRETLNRAYYQNFKGRAVASVEATAVRWFDHIAATTTGLFHDAVVARLRAHQAQGDAIVLVSGSFPAVLAPFAQRLDVQHILATRMEVVDGHYTGELLPPQTIGAGKAAAIAAFLETHGAASEQCHAYGDDISDLPMLSAVAHPVVIAPLSGRHDPQGLAAHAIKAGWPILDPR